MPLDELLDLYKNDPSVDDHDTLHEEEDDDEEVNKRVEMSCFSILNCSRAAHRNLKKMNINNIYLMLMEIHYLMVMMIIQKIVYMNPMLCEYVLSSFGTFHI